VVTFGILDITDLQVIAAIMAALVAVPLVALCVASYVHHRRDIRNWPYRAEPPGLLDAILSNIVFISGVTVLIELGFLFIPLTLLGTVCFVLIFVGSLLLDWLLGIVIARLTGDDRLRRIVIS
jgi:hypothetical protein